MISNFMFIFLTVVAIIALIMAFKQSVTENINPNSFRKLRRNCAYTILCSMFAYILIPTSSIANDINLYLNNNLEIVFSSLAGLSVFMIIIAFLTLKT